MQYQLPVGRAGTRQAYCLGCFPWRTESAGPGLTDVCCSPAIRFSLVCPWSGPHGVFQCQSNTPVSEVWTRYQQPDTVTDFVPVWPGLSDDRVWVVPRGPAGSNLVCVVAQQQGTFKSILLPTPLTYNDMCRVVQYLTGWEVGQIRVPPGLHARQLVEPSAPLHLRDGDFLDVLASRGDCHGFEVSHASRLKDHVLWTRPIRVACRLSLYVWLPEIWQPILTWLPAGSTWEPHSLTFSGAFANSFPGRWVPVVWSPTHVPHLVRAREDSGRVTILTEDDYSLRCRIVDAASTRDELGQILHTDRAHVDVLGVAAPGSHRPIHLRDGDIVRDTVELRDPSPPWQTLWSAGRRSSIGTLLLGICLGNHVLYSSCLLGVVGWALPGAWGMLALQDVEAAGRSRSPPSRVGRRAGSPRIGCWQYDVEHPALEVCSQSNCHYSVLCPFRGRCQPAHCTRDVPHSALMHVLRSEAGPWAVDFLAVGGEEEVLPATLLPIVSGSLATIIVQTADTTRSLLVPAYSSFRHLGAHLRRVVPGWGLTVSPPPALRKIARDPDAVVRLRHGDAFEMGTDMCHPQYRHRPMRRVTDLASLPHLNV